MFSNIVYQFIFRHASTNASQGHTAIHVSKKALSLALYHLMLNGFTIMNGNISWSDATMGTAGVLCEASRQARIERINKGVINSKEHGQIPFNCCKMDSTFVQDIKDLNFDVLWSFRYACCHSTKKHNCNGMPSCLIVEWHSI